MKSLRDRVKALAEKRARKPVQDVPKTPLEVCIKQWSPALLAHDVTVANKIEHNKWQPALQALCNKPGVDILEIGSRSVIFGGGQRAVFPQANYTGFDIYPGVGVDVVGDAHMLSSYFTKKFDLILSLAVFEHLAMPWIAAQEIAKLLKVGGYVFIETHYSYSSHERPWHFFQFSEEALKVLFSEKMGFRCIEAGVSNPIVGFFSEYASPYLRYQPVGGLYCHSAYLGQKIADMPFSWDSVRDVAEWLPTHYPKKTENP
ncbi:MULTISPECIES: class I SAM-dependent methyltransferase [unclassified Desulfovibrio]|uniref:class I SAM-dependent methyltransferase n=1 Tax=unclassified Desulfovibrio TaxID=2593640 RepID=UPI0013EC73B8|nr:MULTISPECIES: class I SAM-dependent methyltransferase [unclassified Desulfovibrio]